MFHKEDSKKKIVLNANQDFTVYQEIQYLNHVHQDIGAHKEFQHQ